MSAAIIPIAAKSAEDAAWDAYEAHRLLEAADPALQVNRAHMEQSARLHDAWRRLFLANERTADVVRFDGVRR